MHTAVALGMSRVLALGTSTIFMILAGWHVYMAVVSSEAESSAVPSVNGKPLFKPSRRATLVVAVVLLGCAALVADIGGLARFDWLPRSVSRVLGYALALGLFLRAVGDFRYVGFFKRVRGSGFANMDTYFYSPLCLLLSIAVLWVALSGAPASAASANVNSPTGTTGLIMVDKVGGQIRFFDPKTDRELAAFAPDPQPGIKAHEVAISPDHKTAYVTVYGDGVYGRNPNPGHAVAIIDLATRRKVGSIELAPHQAPHGIQVDAAGMLYVACDLSRKVLVLDPVKRSIVAAIDVEGTGHWLALLPDASKLYVANKNDKPFVSVVDVKTRKMIGKVPVPHGTQGIVASPDGKRVLVADDSEPVLHVISPESDTLVDQIRVTGVPGGLYKVFYSADGRRVLTAQPSGQVNILDAADLHAPQKVVKSAGTALMGFAFSPDGKLALVGNHGQGTVSRIDLETATVIKTFPAGQGVETLAYF